MRVGNISGSMPDTMVQISDILRLYREGSLQLSKETAADFHSQVIMPLQSKVFSYCMEFDMASKSYLRNNGSTLSKMAKVILNPVTKNRSQLLDGVITDKTLNNRKRSTQQMILTMEKGHGLLLNIREAFTGSSINTRFIVQVGNKTYAIDESKLNAKMVLSAFGGGTVSNPFSLSYQIDKELVASKEFLDNAEEISDSEVWQKIFSLKPEYLDTYKTPITGKKYKHYYFDSKDAEIYESYSQNMEDVVTLTVDRYASLRSSLGGGGGYASAFYKIGDVGSTQVKFFNLKKGASKATVNFARFSLLRDRFRQLYEILGDNDVQRIGANLAQFFTEKAERVSPGVSTLVNNEARQAFNKIFGL